MNKIIHCGIFFFIALLIAAPFTTIKAQAKTNAPHFNDGGKIIDSLKRKFACEAIEFENTADNKKVDSCLTVYLINSAYIFSEYDLGKQSPTPLKNVASAVKRSLTNPNHYKTIYVFLVNRYKQNGKDMTIRTAGLEISTKALWTMAFFKLEVMCGAGMQTDLAMISKKDIIESHAHPQKTTHLTLPG